MDVRLRGVDHALVLGFPDPADYQTDGQYLGAVIGRYANRIAVSDRTPPLERNENDTTHLHGGAQGFAVQTWDVTDQTDSTLTLTHHSPDGHAGHVGNMTATAIYAVEGTTLGLRLTATCDQDTIVNLCHHPYFNLDGRADISGHALWIDALRYLPASADLMPTGEVSTVRDTLFDFRQRRHLPAQDFNNTYALHDHQVAPLSHVATLRAGRVTMDLHSTQPGLHLYNGYKIRPKTVGHNGAPYGPYAGICLEAQAWPDSPNHDHFPPVTLRTGATLTQTVEYRFNAV